MLRTAVPAFAFVLCSLLQVSGEGRAVAFSAARAEDCFDEAWYLQVNQDVATAVKEGRVPSARVHYDAHGKTEGRKGCPPPRTRMNRIRELGLLARTSILGLLVVGILFWSLRRRWGPVPTSLALAAAMAGFAWFDYLTGRLVFIFMDIASDTGNQFWPMMTFFSRQIWSGHLPMWSFEVGLGQNMFPGWLTDPFTLLAILSGESALPYALGPVNVLKILCAVACLAGYFQLRGYSRTSCIAGALSIAFCGHMVSRGTWYEYGTEVAVVSLYLYALERFLQSGRFVLLALATFFIGCFGTYYAYLYFFLLTTFALVRIFAFGDRLFTTPRGVLARWAAASALGVLLVTPFLLPDILATLRSPWVSGDSNVMTGNLRGSIFEREHGQVLLTAIARQLSPNLLGGANRYTGYANYLEAPLAYVGVLPLLCVIPCFVLGGRRLRIVLASFVALALGYHFFVYFRLAIDAFVGPIFKISNLWIAVGLGLCAARALDLMERRRAPPAALAASMTLVFGMLAAVDLFAHRYTMTVDRELLWTCAAAALACTACLALIAERRTAQLALQCIVAAAAIELTLTAYQSANVFRGALDGAAPRASIARYDDDANKVIRRIRSSDPSAFRIERDKNSVFLMDALMQDYYGTKSYMSSYASPSYAQFLLELGLLDKRATASSYIDGIGPRSAILPLLGVKYYLSTKGDAPPGWVKQFEEGGIQVFVNPEASLGFHYHQSVARGDFARLAPVEKQAALLHAAVVESPSAGTLERDVLRAQADSDLAGCTDKESCLLPARVHDELEHLAAVPVRFDRFEENEIHGSVSAREPGVLFLAIPFDGGWRLLLDGHEQKLQRVNIGFLGVDLAPGDHEFLLRYRTPGLLPGAWLALAASLVLAGWALLPALRRRAWPGTRMGSVGLSS